MAGGIGGDTRISIPQSQLIFEDIVFVEHALAAEPFVEFGPFYRREILRRVQKPLGKVALNQGQFPFIVDHI